MTEATYVCPACGATTERSFRTASVMRSCENGCAFGHHVRSDLLTKIEALPEADRPDDWSERSVRERLFAAMRAGAIARSDL